MKKVQEKKSFVLQKSLEYDIMEMSGDEVKLLMFCIFGYVSRGEIPDLSSQSNRAVRIAFNRFAEDYKRDSAAWIETCNRNRENAHKRWGKSK